VEPKQERIQKYLSECGETSRRKAEELVAAGRVTVNGEKARTGQSVTPGKDRVAVDGRAVTRPRSRLYIALNKPRGYVTTMNDEYGRRCVTELVSGIGERVYPVGRLDMSSEGLLLLTDDGVFANAMMHPKHHVPKVYRVSVYPAITGQQVKRIENGIEIDGRVTAPALVNVVTHDEEHTVVEITLFEGRNREIRKMCETLGLRIGRLSRVAIGNLRLGGLRPGEWRELEPREISSLMRMSGVIVVRKKEEQDDRNPAKKR
jgi:23S rRNA pseudouridine2605 synthase